MYKMKKGFGYWLIKETARGFTATLIGGKGQKTRIKFDGVVFPTLSDVKAFCKGELVIEKRTVRVTRSSVTNR